jgi:hypothetical protein
MKALRISLAAAALAMAALVPAGGVAADPASVAARSTANSAIHDKAVTDVRYRGRWGRHHGHRGHGGAIAAGIAGLVIGGILLSAAEREEHRRVHHDAWERCADTFRSFDWDSGTYVTSYGERRPCPYLG